MEIKQYIRKVMDELEGALNAISPGEAKAFADAILKAERIFVAGAGRSGLAAKAFAMRLMHLGLPTYVVGDVDDSGHSRR